MPARDARNAVRSSVLTQADVHFEAFSAGRRAPADLGLPSPALEFVVMDDAAGGAVVSDAVKATLGYIGIDPTGFCCRSMRIGALTAGVIAGAPEAVLYLQPGHGQFKAGRVYMHDFSAATLYATSRALGL